MDSGPPVEEQMEDLFSGQEFGGVKECIAEYGKFGGGDDPSFERGIERIKHHFDDILTDTDLNNKFVFKVILAGLKHTDSRSDADVNAPEDNAAVDGIIKKLQDEIPRRYLHIPQGVAFSVGGKELPFTFWLDRLVELTRVKIPIWTNKSWDKGEIIKSAPDYEIVVFIGFDWSRVLQSQSTSDKKSCALYIYSRVSSFASLSLQLFRVLSVLTLFNFVGSFR